MRNGLIATVLASGFLMAAGLGATAQAQTGSSGAECTQQTVDYFGQADGIAYRYWMLRLKTAVKDDDRKALSEMVFYPMVWNRKDGTVSIKDKREFLKNFDEIFTPELKAKIASQNVKCLPGDDEGADVGNGELRFFKFAKTNEFEITSISQPGIVKSNKLPWE
jgi:hypothetical protein